MPRPLLVINPQSAAGATARHFDDIISHVRRHLGEHDHAFTKGPLHAVDLARDALRQGGDLVVAVGGDGTINEVVNGFFEPARPGEPDRPIRPGATLAVLPRGTGGDLRRTIGIAGDLKSSAAHLAGERRAIDVGRCDYTDFDGRPASRYFVNVAGCGVGAEIVRIANSSSKVLGGKLTFMLSSLRGLIGWADVGVRATVDQGAPEDLQITSFSIANGRFFGGGMMVAPEARLNDGLFHFTVWTGFGFKDFALNSGRMYDGSHVQMKGTRTGVARAVRLEPADPSRQVCIELDGELVGKLPASYRILPGAIQLLS